MAGKQKKTAKRLKKEDYWVRLQKAVSEYKNVLFIDADNVSSLQVLKIRARLREIGALMIMGKNVSIAHSINIQGISIVVHHRVNYEFYWLNRVYLRLVCLLHAFWVKGSTGRVLIYDLLFRP